MCLIYQCTLIRNIVIIHTSMNTHDSETWRIYQSIQHIGLYYLTEARQITYNNNTYELNVPEGEINEEEDLDPGDGLYINPRKSQRSFRSFRNSVKRFIVRNEEMSSLEDESKSCNTVKYPRGTGTNAKKKVQVME